MLIYQVLTKTAKGQSWATGRLMQSKYMCAHRVPYIYILCVCVHFSFLSLSPCPISLNRTQQERLGGEETGYVFYLQRPFRSGSHLRGRRKLLGDT